MTESLPILPLAKVHKEKPHTFTDGQALAASLCTFTMGVLITGLVGIVYTARQEIAEMKDHNHDGIEDIVIQKRLGTPEKIYLSAECEDNKGNIRTCYFPERVNSCEMGYSTSWLFPSCLQAYWK